MATSLPTDEINNIPDASLSSYRKYLVFFGGQILSLFGSEVVMFAVIWEMTKGIGNNNSLLSLAFFLGFLPFVIFSPIAGVVADKYDKKKIMLISDSFQAILTFCLFLIMITTDVKLWQFILFNSLRGICQAFHMPVGFTLISLFVPKNKLTRFNGLHYLLEFLIQIIAAPVAVLLLLVMDLKILLWLDIITFGIAAIPLLKLKIPKNESNDVDSIDLQNTDEYNESRGFSKPIKSKKGSFIQDFKEGIKTIADIPGLIYILIHTAIFNFYFRSFSSLWINFIKYSHGGDIIQYGIFNSCVNIGVFIGAIVVSLKKKWHHWPFYVIGGLIFPEIILLFISLVPKGNFLMLYISIGFMWILGALMNSLINSLYQLKIPPEKMGRVVSIIITLSAVLGPIGIIIAGPIADAIDSIPLFYTGIAILSILTSILFLFRPKVINLLKEGEKLSHQVNDESEKTIEKEKN